MSDTPNSKQVGLRVNKETYEALALMARVEDLSIGKIAQLLVVEGVKGRKDDPEYVERIRSVLEADLEAFS